MYMKGSHLLHACGWQVLILSIFMMHYYMVHHPVPMLDRETLLVLNNLSDISIPISILQYMYVCRNQVLEVYV